MFRQLLAGQLSSIRLGSADFNERLTPLGAGTLSSLAHTSSWVSGS